DMRTPIAQPLAYPDRIDAGVPPLDLARIGSLVFEQPDFARFPALGLAYAALKSGGSAPATLNAANEVAVAAFLEGRLPFLEITSVIEETLASLGNGSVRNLDEVLDADARARARAGQVLARLNSHAAGTSPSPSSLFSSRWACSSFFTSSAIFSSRVFSA